MKRSRFFHLSVLGCKAGTVLLAWAFLSGLLAGTLVSDGSRAVFAGARQALSHPAGVSAFIPTVMPLLFSGFAVFAKHPLLLIPAAFWKAFFFSCVASGLVLAWGKAGWLVGVLTLFGSFCSLSVLWWYWLRHIGGEAFSNRTFFAALGAMALIGWVDLMVISPFLTNILIF